MTKKIFADAAEKYVKTVVFYGKKSDNFLYTDEGMKTKASFEEVSNAFLKGAVVLYDGSYCMPLSFKVEASKVTVNIATVATSAIAPVALTSDTKQ